MLPVSEALREGNGGERVRTEFFVRSPSKRGVILIVAVVRKEKEPHDG
jgi:hypothetical protein